MSGKILVIGATGNVGAPLVAELASRGEKVKAAARTKPANLPNGAEWVKFDYADVASIDTLLGDVDRIYALTPAGSLDPIGLLTPIVKAAAARGIKVVLQTALGVDADDNIPVRQVEIALEKSGAPWVVLRPNWFSDNLVNYWGEGVKAGVLRLPAGDAASSLIDTRDIAASAAGALTSDAHNGKAFNLTGPAAYTYAQAAELLSKAIGRQVTYTAVDGETFVNESVAHGVPQPYAEFLAAIFHPVAQGWTAGVTGDVKTLSGKEPRSLETTIADLAPKLKA
ncbi:MAG: SDR family oxidoreductase [Mesorhizobium sp.]